MPITLIYHFEKSNVHQIRENVVFDPRNTRISEISITMNPIPFENAPTRVVPRGDLTVGPTGVTGR